MSPLEESTLPMSDRAPRNLVLCFDGTGDWVGFDQTNVAQIFSKLVRDENQLTFYDGGVGTLTSPQALTATQRTALRLIDLGVATGLREKVLNGYNFLVENYQPGDRIFMFGFSRGAYTARLVAAMVHNFGIVRPESEVISQYLWQTLESIPPGREADDTESPIGVFKRTANRLKRDFSRRGVKIHFMGLFDTVSSVGVLRRFNVYPNTDKNLSVLRVCHAVSIDEQRNAFPETLFHPKQPGLTEVWFPGVHRDIGGGLKEKDRRIADEALTWISSEAAASGLLLTETFTPDKTLALSPNYPKYDPYVFLGLYPMKMFVKRVSDFRFIWPNFRHTRTIPENAFIHDTAKALVQAGQYHPANLPKEPKWFATGDQVAADPRYLLRSPKFSGADFVGTCLGTTLLLLLWNQAAGMPLKTSWPVVSKAFAIPRLTGSDWHLSFSPQGDLTLWYVVEVLFLAFFASQFVGQRYTAKLPKAVSPRSDLFLGIAGLVVIVWALLFPFEAESAVKPCLFSGLLIAALSQAPGLPLLPAHRALPSVLWAGIGGAIIYGLLGSVLNANLDREVGVFFVLAVILIAVTVDIVWDRLKQRDEEKKALEMSRKRKPAEKHRFPPNASATLARAGISIFLLSALVRWLWEHFGWGITDLSSTEIAVGLLVLVWLIGRAKQLLKRPAPPAKTT
jgi:hypothetical protein